MYRNPLILAHAQHWPCQYCGRDDGTVVAAHSNMGRHGKGGRIKAHDCFVAYLCRQCHQFVDEDHEAPGYLREAVWWEGHRASIPLFAHLLSPEGWQLLDKDAT